MQMNRIIILLVTSIIMGFGGAFLMLLATFAIIDICEDNDWDIGWAAVGYFAVFMLVTFIATQLPI